MSVSPCKLYTMTMVCERGSDRVLVLDRLKNDWPGLTFPGGHVENGESLTACAVREIAEETGLIIQNPVPCGVVHWADAASGLRYLEFLYKTDSYSGTLSDGTAEGRVFFMPADELQRSERLSPNFVHYLPVFFSNTYTELFFEWDGRSFDGVPQYFPEIAEKSH